MKREETIDYNIKAAWHAISRMYNQYGAHFDVTASNGFVLLNIDAENGTPATKIAPMLGLESRSLTRILKSMEEKKWIYREKDPEDGRSVRIFLTDEGKAKREISRLGVREFNKKVQEYLSPEQMAHFFEVVRTVIKVADNRDYVNTFLEQLKLEEIKY